MANVLPFPQSSRFKVFVVAASDPPPPPEGAQALKIVDTETGVVMTWGWSHPVVDSEMLLDRSWAWAERLAAMFATRAAASDAG